jgi:acetolactate synthase-1/2/3 large subunit
MVQCLENEGVEYVFGIPGEENIRLINAMKDSHIRFITVRHEQAASFMADMYGRVTGKPGVCAATLGPGAINLLLGTADAFTNSTPLVAISAQVGLNRVHKETHQIIDLLSMFKPVTKWAGMIVSPAAVPEMVRQAFKKAETERPGATYLGLPEDVEAMSGLTGLCPLARSDEPDTLPAPWQIALRRKSCKQRPRPSSLPATAQPETTPRRRSSGSRNGCTSRSPPRSWARASSPITIPTPLALWGSCATIT